MTPFWFSFGITFGLRFDTFLVPLFDCHFDFSKPSNWFPMIENLIRINNSQKEYSEGVEISYPAFQLEDLPGKIPKVFE